MYTYIYIYIYIYILKKKAITLNGEIFNAFPPKINNWIGCPFSPLLFGFITEVLWSAKDKKEMKCMRFEEKEMIMSLSM